MSRGRLPSTVPAVIPPAIDAAALRRFTDARVALGRAGSSLTTSAHLRFVGDHARARDAVWTAVDFEALAGEMSQLGLTATHVHSRAIDRATYLRRPDLGRLLDDASVTRLSAAALVPAGPVALVVADGLSAEAVRGNTAPVVRALLPMLATTELAIGSVVLAEQGRVAIGDAIGEAVDARLSVVLIGERPGLSAADSLGCYITWEPRVGTPDSRRNCISNIRTGGLSPADAAGRIAWIVNAAFERRLTGIALKPDDQHGAFGSGSSIQLDPSPRLPEPHRSGRRQE